MRSTKMIHVVNCHAAGEVGDVIVGGVNSPPGKDVWEKSRFIAQDQVLRDFMLNEPRGGVFRNVNLLVPSSNPSADLGWIIMEACDTPPMSGSNSICVATAILETGIIPIQEPETSFNLEAPAGIIKIRAKCKNGKVEKVIVENVPSFVYKLERMIEVSGIGTLKVDVAYGGDSFVFTEAKDLGFILSADEAREISEYGIKITKAANEQIGFVHPINHEWRHISFCQMVNPVEDINGIITGTSAVVIQPGKVDRSPCGTGCSARMALLKEKGLLRVGDYFNGRSILGTEFNCQIKSEIQIGTYKGINPIISGSAWITGTSQHMLDPSDPFPTGYKLSDTWPRTINE